MSIELFAAIEQHDVDLVRELVARSPNLSEPNENGWRPLHAAIGELGVGGPVETVRILIEHGANVNEWDVHHNETPLLSACFPEAIEAARALLEAGADPNVRRSDGLSPLRLCVYERDRDMAVLLLAYGADERIDEFGGEQGMTALGIAASQFDLPMIDLLLEAGADPEATDDCYGTARDRLPPREECDPKIWDDVMERLGRRRT